MKLKSVFLGIMLSFGLMAQSAYAGELITQFGAIVKPGCANFGIVNIGNTRIFGIRCPAPTGTAAIIVKNPGTCHVNPQSGFSLLSPQGSCAYTIRKD